ncbi:MAG: isoaspartyl peptidase/L-asparaginase [Pyrinomonadaceae bacterium]
MFRPMHKSKYRLLTAGLVISFVFAALPVSAQRPAVKGGKTGPGDIGPNPDRDKTPPFGFVIHGGAGTLRRSEMTPELEREYRAKLTEALLAGYNILKSNGTALDAVEAAIKLLEDSPLFNAGKGAVFTSEGTNELDASIMEGNTMKAGAVAGVRHIKNPISLARLVMEKSPHVLIAGDGAEVFAKQQGVSLVPAEYFYTERRWNDLQKAKAAEKAAPAPKGTVSQLGLATDARNQAVNRFGTVGAVALDKSGNLAAGTSTGGKTNKRPGRIGDSPIIGAGTYANNETCAISATGDGEFFIRWAVAHDISALMAYQARPIEEAARLVILGKLKKVGGEGGAIGIDRLGNMTLTFNSEGMYRGYVRADGVPVVRIYQDEGQNTDPAPK